MTSEFIPVNNQQMSFHRLHNKDGSTTVGQEHSSTHQFFPHHPPANNLFADPANTLCEVSVRGQGCAVGFWVAHLLTHQTSTKSFATLAHLVHDNPSAPPSHVPNLNRYGWLTQHMNFSTAPAQTISGSRNALIVTGEDTGKQYNTHQMPALKPGILQKRPAQCTMYIGQETGIRQSPWKLNRVFQLAAGLTWEGSLDAIEILYCQEGKVRRLGSPKNQPFCCHSIWDPGFATRSNQVVHYKVNYAEENETDGKRKIRKSALDAAFKPTTIGALLLFLEMNLNWFQIRWMHRKFSKIRVVLREIDFPLRIYQQKSLNQKKKWLQHQQRSEEDAQ